MIFRRSSSSVSRHSLHGSVRGSLAFLLLLVAGFALSGWYWSRAERPPELPYELVEIVRGDLEESVVAQGKLEPREYVDVGAQVSGQLRAIHVEIGDVVQAGDLIAEIDPRVYQARVDGNEAALKTLRAQLEEQRAQVELAARLHERNRRLIKTSVVSQEALDDSETQLAVARARVTALEAQVEEARSTLAADVTNLGYTKIFAPMSGTVVMQPSRTGQTLNASQSAPVIVQIANLDAMTARAQVAEADVMRIRPGMSVRFNTLGQLERQWRGTVRQILPSPEVINDVVLYNALVDVDNRDRGLMSGMSTQMFFVLGSARGVPLIPVRALGPRLPELDNAQGRAYSVRVARGAGVTEQTVHIGLMHRAQAEVRSGLVPGDRVAVDSHDAPDSTPAFARMPRL